VKQESPCLVSDPSLPGLPKNPSSTSDIYKHHQTPIQGQGNTSNSSARQGQGGNYSSNKNAYADK